MSTSEIETLKIQVAELEARFMFQEDNLDALTKRCSEQDQEINRLLLQIKHLADKIKHISESDNVSGVSIEQQLPPHY